MREIIENEWNSTGGAVSDIVKNSVLSAEAAEFVPMAYTAVRI